MECPSLLSKVINFLLPVSVLTVRPSLRCLEGLIYSFVVYNMSLKLWSWTLGPIKRYCKKVFKLLGFLYSKSKIFLTFKSCGNGFFWFSNISFRKKKADLPTVTTHLLLALYFCSKLGFYLHFLNVVLSGNNLISFPCKYISCLLKLEILHF